MCCLSYQTSQWKFAVDTKIFLRIKVYQKRKKFCKDKSKTGPTLIQHNTGLSVDWEWWYGRSIISLKKKVYIVNMYILYSICNPFAICLCTLQNQHLTEGFWGHNLHSVMLLGLPRLGFPLKQKVQYTCMFSTKVCFWHLLWFFLWANRLHILSYFFIIMVAINCWNSQALKDLMICVTVSMVPKALFRHRSHTTFFYFQSMHSLKGHSLFFDKIWVSTLVYSNCNLYGNITWQQMKIACWEWLSIQKGEISNLVKFPKTAQFRIFMHIENYSETF